MAIITARVLNWVAPGLPGGQRRDRQMIRREQIRHLVQALARLGHDRLAEQMP